MKDSEIEKKQGVNFDFILALKSEDGVLSVEKIDITRNDKLIDGLIEKYYNSKYDAADVYKYAKRLIPTCYTYPLCLKYNYYDSFINDVVFPELNVYEYRKKINRQKENIAKVLKREHRKAYERLKAQFDEFVRSTKKFYLKNIVSYIYAYDYNRTLIMNSVKDKYRMFSSEIHGRFTYETVVNEDLKIVTNTNFCYGNSSYFHVIVKYKDIALLPYGEWVKYYYAGYNAIMRYTRSYPCCRESWIYAMNFIKEFVNKAINDPDEFVKKDIALEVETLMSGLEEIFKMRDVEFERLLKVQRVAEDDVRYIGVSSSRHANEQDREYYKIRKTECAMIYKMEKISGALHFLNGLKSISTIIPGVEDAINRIVDLNNSIYPDIINAIPPISQEIDNLTHEYQKIESLYKKKNIDLEPYENRLNDLKKRYVVKKFYFERILPEFMRDNPQYEILIKEANEVRRKMDEYSSLIHDRERVIKRLSSFRKLIETTIK